jgi:hypothetical protein
VSVTVFDQRTGRMIECAPSALELMCRTISALWPQDGWAPNVTMSMLADGTAYASIVRYPHGSRSKQVVLWTKEKTMEEAVNKLAVALDRLMEEERD